MIVTYNIKINCTLLLVAIMFFALGMMVGGLGFLQNCLEHCETFDIFPGDVLADDLN